MTASRSWLLASLLVLGLVGLSANLESKLASPRKDDGSPSVKTPRSLVLMIADGFGLSSLTLARASRATPLQLDQMMVGSVGTASSSSLITDSAASATALATGFDTDNGVVGLDSAGEQLTNLVEKAREAGLRTGVVTTTSMTHATPAAFTAHVMSRSDEEVIALQQLESGVDVLLGGGRDFLTASRSDGRNLLDEARASGWSVVETTEQFLAAGQTPLLGVFAARHFAYCIDTQSAGEDSVDQPTLAEMTSRALELLSQDGAAFVLVVEGGRIDHAGHDNDIATHLQEIFDFDAAVGVARDFAEVDGKTLVVSVSDHETGGLALGRNHGSRSAQDWDPSILKLQSASLDRMIERIKAGESVLDVFSAVGGVADLEISEEELLASAQAFVPDLETASTRREATRKLSRVLMEPLARRASIEWATRGHSAVDVPLFASGVGWEQFVGNRTHAELGQLLQEVLQLDEESLAQPAGAVSR
ncbi:MAG: alkaline phosphatase [Planctomycetota bacterium]|nr:alkaline phosphatase [Planctomycetota bacterium]